MTEVHVPPYDWNAKWATPEEAATEALRYGDLQEGAEFQLIRLTVGACMTYRIIDGKPTPVSMAFPEGLEASEP